MSTDNRDKEKQKYSTSLSGFHFFRSNNDKDISQIERLSKKIYQNRHAILNDAQKEVGTNDAKKILIVFYRKINEQFEKENIKLSDIVSNKYATQYFASSTSLSNVWKIHMQIMHLQARESHMEKWAKDIFDRRDQLWSEIKKSYQTDQQRFIDFMAKIMQELKSNSFTAEELLNNPKACEHFKKSARLKLVLDIITKLHSEKNNQHNGTSGIGNVSPEIDHDKDRPNEIRRLAQAHAKDGVGIMTRLDLKGRNQAELAPIARKIVLANHPDKNPNGDEVIYAAARDLLGLIKEGLLHVYEQALDKARSRSI